MAMNGSCYFESDVTPSQWHSLNETYRNMALPADEYFQWGITITIIVYVLKELSQFSDVWQIGIKSYKNK